MTNRYRLEDWELGSGVAKCVVDKVVKMYDRQVLSYLPLTECITQRQQDEGMTSDQRVGLRWVDGSLLGTIEEQRLNTDLSDNLKLYCVGRRGCVRLPPSFEVDRYGRAESQSTSYAIYFIFLHLS